MRAQASYTITQVKDGNDLDGILVLWKKTTSESAPAKPSGTNLNGWSEEMPEFEAGAFVWTCNRVAISDPTASVLTYIYTDPVLDTAWQKLDDLNTQGTEIKQLVDSVTIKFTGADGKETSFKLANGTLDLTGLVTFYDLTTEGKTEINGSNITTGTINADLITAGTINGIKYYSDDPDIPSNYLEIYNSGLHTRKIATNSLGYSVYHDVYVRPGVISCEYGDIEQVQSIIDYEYDGIRFYGDEAEASREVPDASIILKGYEYLQIRGIVPSAAWHKGRDNAMIASTNSATATSYFPILDVKAQTGDWSMGCLGDALYFVRTEDSNYTANTNSTIRLAFTYDGGIAAPNSITIDPGTTTYTPFISKRKIGSATYQADFGVGNPATGEAAAQMRFLDSSGETLNAFVVHGDHAALRTGSILTPGGFKMYNSSYLYGSNTSGVARIIAGINASNNLVLGYGGYEASEGWTNIYGNNVNITSKGDIRLTPMDNAYGYIRVQYGSSKPMIFPATNGGGYCGGSSFRWQTVYAVNGTINTSDRNAKENILDISEKYEELFKRLRPVTYKLKGGEHDRTHVGFIAQEVEEAMAEVGLTAEDFAALCIDDKMEYDEETGEERIVLDENGEPVKLYSLRYQEFDGLKVHMIQKLMNEVCSLREDIKEMKGIS